MMDDEWVMSDDLLETGWLASLVLPAAATAACVCLRGLACMLIYKLLVLINGSLPN